jgi:hypothetical protein
MGLLYVFTGANKIAREETIQHKPLFGLSLYPPTKPLIQSLLDAQFWAQ